jgi:hypothetical protein
MAATPAGRKRPAPAGSSSANARGGKRAARRDGLQAQAARNNWSDSSDAVPAWPSTGVDQSSPSLNRTNRQVDGAAPVSLVSQPVLNEI